MIKIILEFTNTDANSIAYFLRKRYGKDKRTDLKKLCEIAVRKEVAVQAKHEVDSHINAY